MESFREGLHKPLSKDEPKIFSPINWKAEKAVSDKFLTVMKELYKLAKSEERVK